MRCLGIDVGTARIGVALSDELGVTAGPLLTLEIEGSLAETAARIADLCTEHDVGTVVVGLPLSLEGRDRGQSASRARKLGERVAAAAPVEVVYRDERFTTAEAERVLVTAGLRRSKRRQVVDKVAASLILQSYLDARARPE